PAINARDCSFGRCGFQTADCMRRFLLRTCNSSGVPTFRDVPETEWSTGDKNVNRTPTRLFIGVSTLLLCGIGFAEDTELRDLDASHWSCLNKPGGTPTKPDEQQRNLMKNRDLVRALPPNVEQLDVSSFLRKVAAYDATLKATRR